MKKIIKLLIISCFFTIVACQKQPVVEEEKKDDMAFKQLELLSDEYDLMSDGGIEITMNGYGDILKPKDIHYRKVSDILTGDIVYYVAWKKEFYKNKDNDYETKFLSRLYDLEGNILIDWKEIDYADALGDCIIMRDHYDFMMFIDKPINGYLYNVKTKKKIDNVYNFEKLNNQYVVGYDANQKILGVYNNQGIKTQSIIDESKNGTHYFTCGQYLVNSNENEEDTCYTFYDYELNMLGTLSHQRYCYINNENILDSYIECNGRLYNPSLGKGKELEPILQSNNINYFDGEIAILTDEEDKYYIYDVVNQIELSKKYSHMSGEIYNNTFEKKSDYFIARNKNELVKIDREGTVILSTKIDDLETYDYFKTNIVCHDKNWEKSSLLDKDFNSIVPYGQYEDISCLYENQDNAQQNLWIGRYNIAKDRSRIDILKSDGSVLLKGVSQVGNVIKGKMAISLGRYIGIVDLKGHWIKKLDKYSIENDD